ncbi:hypothetical protein WN48_01531 [Eufriesea mexicana]|uniref:Ig-like domain-containing protein n=1 Tax=Eufriesea mexicana TaxID=516756 RepID=A0A310SL47_9HYME|nr:hypothetical protein WN48_01531 [Eufriesea mexicana]
MAPEDLLSANEKSNVASRALCECWQLVIKSVNVPPTVKADDTDYVILDCDYDLENTSNKGLVVKWFFNTNEVAYQWIYGRDPLAGDTARKYVDLKYKASDDPYTKYRAMKLNKPGIDLTGEYTCVISTFADERSASASMVVYYEANEVFLCPLCHPNCQLTRVLHRDKDHEYYSPIS